MKEIDQSERLQEKLDALFCEKCNGDGGYEARNLVSTSGALHLSWWPGSCDHMDDQADKLLREVA